MFTVHRSEGGRRLVFILFDLNAFLDPPHFHLLSVCYLLALLSPKARLASLDLNLAFHHIPVDQGFRTFHRFLYCGVLFEYMVLPFGLSTKPYLVSVVLNGLADVLDSTGAT